MTLYRTVSLQEATGKVKEVYEDIVDVFNGTNSLANAYQVAPDVIPDPD
jgi:hypothetical protein